MKCFQNSTLVMQEEVIHPSSHPTCGLRAVRCHNEMYYPFVYSVTGIIYCTLLVLQMRVESLQGFFTFQGFF